MQHVLVRNAEPQQLSGADAVLVSDAIAMDAPYLSHLVGKHPMARHIGNVAVQTRAGTWGTDGPRAPTARLAPDILR